MKNMGGMLLTTTPFSEIVMGNTALVRAMVEAGTRVVTSYPGSPTPEIATAIQSIPPDKRPFYFEFSTNEKVAAEVAFGASINGHLATVFFKSVGLNVAADSFVQFSLMHCLGGLVVVLGDDPGANSSQNEQDNRHYARMSYTPVLEPANPTEVYEYYLEAANLARATAKAIILRLTTHVCHAKERVAFKGWSPPAAYDDQPRFDPTRGSYIPITARVFPPKREALAALGRVERWVDERGLHRVIGSGGERGLITSGMVALSAREVLAEVPETLEKPAILKLAMPYPLPVRAIAEFLAAHREVKILEELDDNLEKEIKALAYDQGLTTRIIGKSELDDWVGEYTPDKVRAILHRTWPDLVPVPRVATTAMPVPLRPAQMCPGCGHRSAFHAIKQALPADGAITVADIGCHTLGFQEPYRMGEVLLCMGASTGIGSGLSLFNHSRPVVAFLGDSTFFHAGLPGIVNALFNRHNLTLVLMENGTTAMTGHQEHAASGRNANGPVEAIPVRRVLEGLGVRNIFEVDTYRQKELTELMRQALAQDGFSVVIARHPCMLLFTRNQRRKSGYQARHVHIDQGTCARIHTCVQTFACPSFSRAADGSVSVNPELCIGDGSCIQTCPTGAIARAGQEGGTP
ncbi:MAG: 4Fe-4S binding protein [Desulfobulbus sp.]|jgi:indolepyruvate ferredoxin oxidoreductase alpha subunit|uniref:thiamine pyrophosphate-dependent enzyme n=1 Tax=Desulfobulbus sp. TaxID=895 RepID=UPI00284F18E6|nr:thiamine pyrophosphate-dependent enzyme [Desulfobulbus sp.]MDR2549198.1 4Fe-4S binding protein [Desulfobulbus sp.]